MSLSLYKFGWQEENKTAELEAIQEFLRKNGKPERAEALYALLLDEVNRECYPEDSDLCIEGTRLLYGQYDRKEYYHDGSEQARKFVDIQCIDQEAYLQGLERGTKEAPDRHNFSEGWCACGEDRFFIARVFLWDDHLLYVKDFFGVPFVKIEISYAI